MIALVQRLGTLIKHGDLNVRGLFGHDWQTGGPWSAWVYFYSVICNHKRFKRTVHRVLCPPASGVVVHAVWRKSNFRNRALCSHHKMILPHFPSRRLWVLFTPQRGWVGGRGAGWKRVGCYDDDAFTGWQCVEAEENLCPVDVSSKRLPQKVDWLLWLTLQQYCPTFFYVGGGEGSQEIILEATGHNSKLNSKIKIYWTFLSVLDVSPP